MKIIYCIALMLALMFPGRVSAYWDFEFENIYYKILDDSLMTVEVVSPKVRYGAINIPSKVTKSGNEYSVVSIGYRAFYYCSDLSAISIGEGVKIINKNAFEKCSSLISARLPESLETIDYNAFLDCENLRSITIGKNVSRIGIQSFCRCTNLDKVVIGSSNPKIELRAFGSCPNITLMMISATVPPSNIDRAMEGSNTDAEIIVPKKSLSKYKKDAQWSKFSNIKGI